MRKRRATWKAVAAALAEKGIHRHPAVVRRFYKRALTTRLPAGFEVDQPPPKETTTTHAPPPPELPARESAPPPEDAYWRAVAERKTNPFTADKRH